MVDMDANLVKVVNLASELGAAVLEIDPDRFDQLALTGKYRHLALEGQLKPSGFSEAPFSSHSLAVMYHEKQVIYAAGDEPPWHEVVHELGHILASDTEAEDSDEWEFFGWEYAVVRWLRLPIAEWFDSMKHYQISDDGTCFMDVEDPTSVLIERLEAAAKLKLISPLGRPLSVR